LFERGCLVHVVPAGNFAGSASACTDAGLISIAVVRDEAAAVREAVKRAVGSDRFLTISEARLSADHERAAEEICRTLEHKGYIGSQPKPFIGGAGI
jgi:hypothetical protein